MTTTVSASWADAVAAADTMTAWHRQHIKGAGEAAGDGADLGDWSDAVQLLALALWHIARDQNVIIGDAALDGEVFGYLRGPERLLAEPLPAEVSPPDLAGPFDPVLRRADWIMGHNHCQHPAGRELGNTEDGLPDPFTVADRLAEINQDPEGLPPLPETGRLGECDAAMATALNRRQWLPTERERAVATTAHAAIGRMLPTEPGDTPFDRSWLARLRNLALGGDDLRAVLSSASSSAPAVSPLLTEQLAAIVGLIDAVTEPLSRLEAAWSARPDGVRVPVWERAHLPLPVRSRVRDAEHDLFITASTLSACITGHVDY